MQTFDILDPKLDIMQSRFLEASAGTGKTFAIENLIVRMVKQKIPLQEILAVTFTKEAAHEMKERIRKKLQDIPLDELQIFTIHGFCHRMLTEFAFEAKAPLTLTNPDQPDHLAELRKTVEDFFHTAPSSFAIETKILLKKARYDIKRLINSLVSAVLAKEEPEELAEAEIPPIAFSKMEEDFHRLAPRYKYLFLDKYTPQLEKFATVLEKQDPKLLFSENIWFFEKMHRENERVRQKPLDGPSYFEELNRCLSPYLKVGRDPSEMLKRIAKECRKRWETKAIRSDHFSFDDLLLNMQKALDEPQFLEKIQQKYKVAIIDEFQDTDPIQWDIFQKLFLKNHIIYLVGDPKQSIYGFRNADIYTYMQAAKALGEEKKAVLDTNYRSSPKLIDALNQLFSQNPNWIDLPSLPGSLTYHPVKAGRDENKLDEEPITFFSFEGSQGKERSWPTKSMEETQLFPYIAGEILKLEPKISFSEMAILVKDRFQGMRLQLFLNQYNIPSTLLRTFNLAESYGFLMIETILECAINPENAPLIHSIFPGENPFFKNEDPFPILYAKLAPQFAYNKSLYREMRQTAELLLQKRGSYEELLHYMQELKKLSPEEDERLRLEPEESEESVRIMTTFASKGLEFDVVFALGLVSRHNAEEFDEEKNAEKMRQLYVAFTRPKEKLYIPILIDQENKPQSSPIELFFAGDPPINPVALPKLSPYKKKTERPLAAPKKKRHFDFEKRYLTSFSAMATSHIDPTLSERYKAQDLTKKNLHTLPLGAETGVLIHALFENHFQDQTIPLEQIAFETLTGSKLEGWEEILLEMMEDILALPLVDDFCLKDLKAGDYFQEMEFLFPRKNELVKGFADLIFKIGDTFYVLDWKTNWLGPSDEDYTKEKIQKAMEQHDYFLQAELYGEALQRYVKRLYNNPKFGGAYYIFLRGKGVFHYGAS